MFLVEFASPSRKADRYEEVMGKHLYGSTEIPFRPNTLHIQVAKVSNNGAVNLPALTDCTAQ